MPHYTEDPKRFVDFDNHPYGTIVLVIMEACFLPTSGLLVARRHGMRATAVLQGSVRLLRNPGLSKLHIVV